MECPECNQETLHFGEVIDGSTPCIACGYDMEGVKFYGEASSEYVSITPKCYL